MVTGTAGEPAGFCRVLLLVGAALGLDLFEPGVCEMIWVDECSIGVDGLLGLTISLPFPFTSIIRSSSSDTLDIVDRLRNFAGPSGVLAESFLRLWPYCWSSSPSASRASRRMAGKTSFECLKRSSSLSSSGFSGSALDCCFRATVRLNGSAFFLVVAAVCSSDANVAIVD